jgi:arginine decarboxylase
MSTVRIAWGSATAPTSMAAYDAALAAANAHEFNLVTVSSVLPAEADLEVVGTLPDLGDAGDRLTVVQSRVEREPGDAEPGIAGLGWARSADGPGVLYEASGRDPEAVRERIRTGLEHGASLREWDVADSDVVLQEVDPAAEAHTCAVVLAAYGRGEPIV